MKVPILRFILLSSLVLGLFARYAEAQQIRYVYDDLGRLIAVIDQQGRTAIYEYDAVGNILAIRRPDTTGPVAITFFSPKKGAVGTRVQIFGIGFSVVPSQNQIAFNGVPAPTLAANINALTTQVPDGASSGPISVTTPLGSAVSAEPFTVGQVTVTPSEAILFTSATQQFTATVSVSDDKRVTWSVNGIAGGNATVGIITPEGLYTAPAAVPTPATVTIRATSVPVPGVFGEARATIVVRPTGFQPALAFRVGADPISVAAADLNRDGIPDIVTANVTSGDVSVLLGNGDGTFQAQQRIPAGVEPAAVAVADLNRTGFLDLIVANSRPNAVSILLGNGDGTFQAPQAFPAGTFPISVAVADLNRDGILDVVVANQGSALVPGDVSILLGNGDGTLQAQRRVVAGDNPFAVAVSDLNRDTIPDIVTANQNSDDVSVLLGNGDGTFQAQRRLAVGSFPLGVVVSDLNANGAPDIVTANDGADDVSVLLGNGDGTFQAPQGFGVGSSPVSVAAGDLSGDGIPDVVTANSSDNTVSVLLGNGDGTFQAQQLFGTGSFPRAVAVADLNRDGALDIITANVLSNDVSVLLHK